MPERLGIAGLMGLALLAGLAFAALVGRGMGPVSRWSIALLLAAAMLARVPANPFVDARSRATLLYWPYRLTPAIDGDSPMVAQMRAAGGPVVELPAGLNPWRHTAAMYRAIFHGQPLLNGYGSYWPAGWSERMALADRLPDLDALAALRRETLLAMVLVHTGGVAADRRARWLQLAEGAPGGAFRLVSRDGAALLFAVDGQHGEPARDVVDSGG
jgi:hypothetical protein